MRTKATASLTSRPSLSPQYRCKDIYHHHGDVVEEIEGLIRVHNDGHVERPQIVSCVTAASCPDLNVTSRDIAIDNFTDTWARFYVPNSTISHHHHHHHHQKLPLLIYFHGGGFCVGSASWSCYHEFLSKLSSKLECLIMSLNYRLAPEKPLPAAYEDGFKSLIWVKQQILYRCEASEWWIEKCNFSRIFLAGDSAGANIAYNVATKLSTHEASSAIRPLDVKGMVLIQPFFGGEMRTASEKNMGQSPNSALSLAASDTYWRLALPCGSNRDHQWCNPLAKGSVRFEELRLCPVLVCVSELDILKDRNLELCGALARAGKKVEHLVCKGVGHAFQILSKSQISQSQTHELMARIKSFIMAL